MTPGVPLSFSAILMLRPDCGELSEDARTATIDWGDGSSTPGALARGPAINGLPSIYVSGEHTYAAAGPTDASDPVPGFRIKASVVNQRSGHVLREEHYITRTPPAPATGCDPLTESLDAPSAVLPSILTFRRASGAR